MIEFENIHFGKEKAREEFDKFVDGKSDELPRAYFDLSRKLFEASGNAERIAHEFGKSRRSYEFDLNFGLSLYDILNKQEGFSMRSAAKDDVWRFISIIVIPTIIKSRWDYDLQRFTGIGPKGDARLYLKTLFWYVHLSYQEKTKDPISSTYEILKNNSTSTIIDLVERTGKGYDINLSRELMRQFGKIQKIKGREDLFRKIMKLNTAWLETMIPEFCRGGVEGYVRLLVNEVIHE